MTDCKHNAHRSINYPEQTTRIDGNGKRRPSFEVGDAITLNCPKGCPDIIVDIKIIEKGRKYEN